MLTLPKIKKTNFKGLTWNNFPKGFKSRENPELNLPCHAGVKAETKLKERNCKSIISKLKECKTPWRKKWNKNKIKRKQWPDILASVTINLLLTAFNVISLHMLQTLLPSFF